MAVREPSVSRTFGSWRVKYEFTGSMLQNQWVGVIHKQNGTKKNVIFLKIEGAEAIAEITSSICHERGIAYSPEVCSCEGGISREVE
ncbi:hypothetical protein ACE6H2_001938 [Prunus campanulata]